MLKKIAYLTIDANVMNMPCLFIHSALPVQIEPSGPGSCR